MIEARILKRDDGQISVNVFDRVDLDAGYPMSECIIELITFSNIEDAVEFSHSTEHLEDEWDYEKWRR